MQLEDHVDVIRHDHPRMELVKTANRLAVQESVRNYAGDSRILQPVRAAMHAVELLVLFQQSR